MSTEFFPNNVDQKLLWDTITIKYNLVPIPISINLSKNNYLKIKKFVESILGFFYGFWIDRNSPKQKSIIFLEFNTEYFSTLLKSLKTYDGNVILVNRRRSAVWSMTATKIVRKSGCKVLNFDNILNEDEKRKIHLLVDEYTKKTEKLWENSKFFNDVFQVEDCSFWNVIKAVIMKKYSEKLSEFIFLVCSAKNIFKNMDVRCIVSLNEIGETEKGFLEFNNKKIPSILLEHGFVERVDDTKRFDQLLYLHFKDNIAVWGRMTSRESLDGNNNRNKRQRFSSGYSGCRPARRVGLPTPCPAGAATTPWTGEAATSRWRSAWATMSIWWTPPGTRSRTPPPFSVPQASIAWWARSPTICPTRWRSTPRC